MAITGCYQAALQEFCRADHVPDLGCRPRPAADSGPSTPQHAPAPYHTNPSLLLSARPPTIQRRLRPWLQWMSLDCHANAADSASASATLCPVVHDFIARRHQPKGHGMDGLAPGATTAPSFLPCCCVYPRLFVCMPQSGHVLTSTNTRRIYIHIHVSSSMSLLHLHLLLTYFTPPQSDDSSSTCTPAPRTSGWHCTMLFAAPLPRLHPRIALIMTSHITTQTLPSAASKHPQPVIVLKPRHRHAALCLVAQTP